MEKKDSSFTNTSAWQKTGLILLGLILSLVLLEAGMRLSGFILLSIQEYGNSRSMKQNGAYRILCLGESTTQGQYPQFLEKTLNRKNKGVRFSVIDEGRTGTNTSAILAEVGAYLAEYRPNMVVAMMGINDMGIKYYQDIQESQSWIFRNCRIYRFIRVLLTELLKKINWGTIRMPYGGVLAWKSKFAQGEVAQAKVSSSPPPKPLSSEKPQGKAGESDLRGARNDIKLGWLYLDRGEFSQAEGCFKKALAVDPDNDNIYFGLGRLYQTQGKLPQALDFFKKAIALNPKNDHAHDELGWLYLDRGELYPAEDLLKKALELNPRNDKTYVKLGWVYLHQGRRSLAEDMFHKALELNPKNDNACVGLARMYRYQEKFSEAEAWIRKAVEFYPRNTDVYYELAWIKRVQGKFDEAEVLFEKNVETHPENDQAYIELGGLYRDRARFSQAEALFKKAVEVNPQNDSAYIELSWLCRVQSKFNEAGDFFKKAIELNPKNYKAYILRGRLHWDQGELSPAEDSFNHAIKLDPDNKEAYFQLGGLYREQGKFSQAEGLFKKVIEIDPKNAQALGAMASLYEELDKPGLEKKYAGKISRLRLENYLAMTIDNFRELKKILDAKGIKLVCVQYPMRSAAPLKKIFENDARVIFADNESVFKKAVQKAGYKEYFVDMFAGDFGHCTRKGNELLAQNIADVILTEVFKK